MKLWDLMSIKSKFYLEFNFDQLFEVETENNESVNYIVREHKMRMVSSL